MTHLEGTTHGGSNSIKPNNDGNAKSRRSSSVYFNNRNSVHDCKASENIQPDLSQLDKYNAQTGEPYFNEAMASGDQDHFNIITPELFQLNNSKVSANYSNDLNLQKNNFFSSHQNKIANLPNNEGGKSSTNHTLKDKDESKVFPKKLLYRDNYLDLLVEA